MKYINTSQAVYTNEIVWTGVLSKRNRKEYIVSELQSNQKVSIMKNYGAEYGSHIHMYKDSSQGR
jgi:hypothetical protein